MQKCVSSIYWLA